MKRLLAAVLSTVFLGCAAGVAQAAVLVAKVDVATQTMEVIHYGKVIHTWRVSTARRGYITPVGSWRPKRMHRMWYSRKYDMSPMPYSIFYDGGYAIHGTNAVSRLGSPASHGCIRLDTANAAQLFALAQEVGPGNMKVIVTTTTGDALVN
ncbi:MAG: L,D-transpeptidase [Rhizobiaceae bacterium]|nr:L,D-transpeptidase [Rhizobiaceae bacterium]